MNPVFHTWVSETTLNPIRTKMIVSIIEAAIFRTYSVVEQDFLDMLNSTYCFMNMPQKVIARALEVENISATRYDRYEKPMIINGSNIGVCSVNLVVKEATAPNMIPIKEPPMATTMKLEEPRMTSRDVILSAPMSANDSNIRYNTTDTASLRSDSPKTMMQKKKFNGTWKLLF